MAQHSQLEAGSVLRQSVAVLPAGIEEFGSVCLDGCDGILVLLLPASLLLRSCTLGSGMASTPR